MNSKFIPCQDKIKIMFCQVFFYIYHKQLQFIFMIYFFAVSFLHVKVHLWMIFISFISYVFLVIV